MKYSLIKNNNSKKLIIGISILFCIVILIVGGTYSYLTSSGTKELGNIVSSNDNNVYINYIEDKSYMLDNLIPIKTNDINKALYNENICVDDYGYNVCSAYIFSLQNAYKEVQKINISMIPTANSFTNLKYMLFKINDISTKDVNVITEFPMPLEKNNLNPISLLQNKTLEKKEIATYAILFYIESKTYDQTLEDSGKSFGATIRIDSLTTGRYLIKSFGNDCWDSELVEGTTDRYKLTKFNGLNEDGSVKEECNGFVERDQNGYYSIEIPSSHRGNEIKVLGNSLFDVGDVTTSCKNPYCYTKSIKINEGIEEIGDIKEFVEIESGSFDINEVDLTFKGNGGGLKDDLYLNVELPSTLKIINIASFLGAKLNKINLPSNLEEIGDSAFAWTPLESIVIPKSVKHIGESAFITNQHLKRLTFEGADDNTSNLLEIGDAAFSTCDLTYTDPLNPLVIPSSVTVMGERAFSSKHEIYISKYNEFLKYIRFNGTLTAGNTDWYTSIENGGYTTLVP